MAKQYISKYQLLGELVEGGTAGESYCLYAFLAVLPRVSCRPLCRIGCCWTTCHLVQSGRVFCVLIGGRLEKTEIAVIVAQDFGGGGGWGVHCYRMITCTKGRSVSVLIP